MTAAQITTSRRALAAGDTGRRSFEPSESVQVKVGAMMNLLTGHGWHIVATKGSHRQLKHPDREGRVTLAGKLSDDLHPKTETSILRQAGLRE